MHGYDDPASWIDDVRPALRLLDVKHEDGHYCALTFPGSGEHVRMASLAKLAVALTYVVVGRRKMHSSRSPTVAADPPKASPPKSTLADLAFVAAAVNMAPRCRASRPRPAPVATPPRTAFALVIRHRDASAAGPSKRQARDDEGDEDDTDTDAAREVKVLRRELQAERRKNWISARLVKELKSDAEELTRDHDHVLVSLAQAKARLELLGERDAARR